MFIDSDDHFVLKGFDFVADDRDDVFLGETVVIFAEAIEGVFSIEKSIFASFLVRECRKRFRHSVGSNTEGNIEPILELTSDFFVVREIVSIFAILSQSDTLVAPDTGYHEPFTKYESFFHDWNTFRYGGVEITVRA